MSFKVNSTNGFIKNRKRQELQCWLELEFKKVLIGIRLL